MKIKPLNDKVLIRVLEVEEKTKGGIYIPQTVLEKTQEGIVEAVGDSKEIKVKVGDKVIYDKYSGIQLKIDDIEYLIVSADDILAVIEE